MESDRLPVIAVVGPTATGKTRRAVSLARAFNGEIVSADSRQVYRCMDIGTGKDLDEYGDVPYHLIDICEPGEKYNLFRFLDDYAAVREDIENRGRRVILCGGSGMYVENALNNLTMPRVEPNRELRERLAGKSLDELSAILGSMKKLHNITDVDTVQRALRAIEIQEYYRLHPSQTPVVSGNATPRRPSVVVALAIDRETRRDNISRRLKSRIDNGMIDEVRTLIKGGVDPDTLIYYGLEYKWITLFVTGRIGYDTMFRNLETAIHQFAKRQMTWFRGMEKRGHTLHWLPYDIDNNEMIEKVTQWDTALRV